ncbi:MAG: hypothetical protein HGA22_14705 [Clostridiales bacterium]|nr:hypothetical protein [Clostridiales bacterium]
MSCYNIMTLLVNNRIQNASRLQDILTRSGCLIKMRLGLHEAGNVCSDEGLIILQLSGSQEDISALETSLNSVEGIKAKNSEICTEW